MRFVIHMEPLDASFQRGLDSLPDEPATDAPASPIGVHSGIQQKSVQAAIPGKIDITDEGVCVEGANVGQTVAVQRREVGWDVSLPTRSEQAVESVIAH